MYNDWTVKRILLPLSSIFPSHITFAIAFRSKECRGWEIVKIFPLKKTSLWIRALILGLDEAEFFSLFCPRLLVSLWVSDFDSFGKEDMPNSYYLQNLCSQTPRWAATWLGNNCDLKAPKDAFSTAAASQTLQSVQGRCCRSTGLRAATGLGWGVAQPTSGCCSCATSSLCREGRVILCEPAVQKKPLVFVVKALMHHKVSFWMPRQWVHLEEQLKSQNI